MSNSCGSDTASFVFTVRPAGECPNAVRNTAGVSASLSVFPNPNNGLFTLNVVSGIDAVVNLTITNIMGQKVMEIVTVTNKAYDVSMDMPAGIYFLTAQTGQTLTEAKMEVAGR